MVFVYIFCGLLLTATYGVYMISNDIGFVILMCVITAIFFSLARIRFVKGNIVQHDLSMYRLIWKEDAKNETPEENLAKTKKHARIFIGLLVLLLVLALLPSSPLLTQLLFVVGAIAVLFLVAVLVGFFVHLVPYEKNDNVEVYQEGIKCFNNFFSWKQVQEISFPGSYKAAQKTGRALAVVGPLVRSLWGSLSTYAAAGRSSTTIRIKADNRIFLMEVRKIQKFQQALAAAGYKQSQ